MSNKSTDYEINNDNQLRENSVDFHIKNKDQYSSQEKIKDEGQFLDSGDSYQKRNHKEEENEIRKVDDINVMETEVIELITVEGSKEKSKGEGESENNITKENIEINEEDISKSSEYEEFYFEKNVTSSKLSTNTGLSNLFENNSVRNTVNYHILETLEIPGQPDTNNNQKSSCGDINDTAQLSVLKDFTTKVENEMQRPDITMWEQSKDANSETLGGNELTNLGELELANSSNIDDVNKDYLRSDQYENSDENQEFNSCNSENYTSEDYESTEGEEFSNEELIKELNIENNEVQSQTVIELSSSDNEDENNLDKSTSEQDINHTQNDLPSSESESENNITHLVRESEVISFKAQDEHNDRKDYERYNEYSDYDDYNEGIDFKDYDSKVNCNEFNDKIRYNEFYESNSNKNVSEQNSIEPIEEDLFDSRNKNNSINPCDESKSVDSARSQNNDYFESITDKSNKLKLLNRISEKEDKPDKDSEEIKDIVNRKETIGRNLAHMYVPWTINKSLRGKIVSHPFSTLLRPFPYTTYQISNEIHPTDLDNINVLLFPHKRNLPKENEIELTSGPKLETEIIEDFYSSKLDQNSIKRARH
ncbi:hypothetical protein K502DRAFT_367635 [Neoconidiobolus thromboides FSU 785]|nr:hypothetical protein K502DRAFT_367635 [Neoconidiobolus thromboides FSU 785]